MKAFVTPVTLRIDVDVDQRRQVAAFLGRPGQLATMEELVAFIRSTVTRRFADLPVQPSVQGVPLE